MVFVTRVARATSSLLGNSDYLAPSERMVNYVCAQNQERTDAEIESVKRQIYDSYPAVLDGLGMIAGTPDNVLPKLKKLLDVLRPGIFSFWLEGPVPHKDRLRCLELINRDIIPAMREHGKGLGLVDPFHCAPGLKLLNGSAPEPVSDRAALAL